MKTFIAYPPAGCITGRSLLTALNARKKQTDRPAKCRVLLRWGSAQEFPHLRYDLELNTRQSVALASNKLRALQTLVAAEIPTPTFTGDLTQSIDQFKNKDGFFYVRGANKEVRFDTQLQPGDLYVSKPVLFKRREYRVHVFDGQVLAIYEKVPNEPDRPALFKSYNCSFKLCDPAISRCDETGQRIAVDAVRALGLVFGGVDVIRDKHGNFFVCEVNSAPGLNSTNLDRWVQAIRQYVTSRLGG